MAFKTMFVTFDWCFIQDVVHSDIMAVTLNT